MQRIFRTWLLVCCLLSPSIVWAVAHVDTLYVAANNDDSYKKRTTTFTGVSATFIAGSSGLVGLYDASTYLTARNSTTGNSSASGIMVGQWVGSYNLRRSYLAFPIPAMTTLISATLKLYGVDDGSTTDFNVNVFGARSYKSVVTTADAPNFNGWAATGAYTGTLLTNTWSTSSFTTDWNTLTFATAGLDSIKAAAGDTLWIALVSSRDVAATQPSGNEYVQFSTSASYEPYLSLTYAVSGSWSSGTGTSPKYIIAGSFSATNSQPTDALYEYVWNSDATSDLTDSVKVMVYNGATKTGNVKLTLAGFDSSSAYAPTDSTLFVHLLATTTTATVSWNRNGISTNTWYTTPDIKSIITEWMTNAGWAKNCRIGVFFKDNGSDANKYDYNWAYESGAMYAKMVVYWHDAVTPTVSTTNGRVPIVNGRNVPTIENGRNIPYAR